jgi:hypothetical protein
VVTEAGTGKIKLYALPTGVDPAFTLNCTVSVDAWSTGRSGKGEGCNITVDLSAIHEALASASANPPSPAATSAVPSVPPSPEPPSACRFVEEFELRKILDSKMPIKGVDWPHPTVRDGPTECQYNFPSVSTGSGVVLRWDPPGTAHKGAPVDWLGRTKAYVDGAGQTLYVPLPHGLFSVRIGYLMAGDWDQYQAVMVAVYNVAKPRLP